MVDLKAMPRALRSFAGWSWSLLLCCILVGTILRLHMLGVKSLWNDEAFSVLVARLPWVAFLQSMWWGEANMALYYFMLRIWLHLGDTEFWLRSLSALFGVINIAAIYASGERFLSRRAGLVAAALFAVHSYHIRYSQELRSYTLLTLLLVLSTHAFLSALERPDRKALWALYVLFSALAVYAQVFAVFVICSHWVSLAPSRVRRLGIIRLLSVGAVLGILLAPIAAVMFLENKGQLDWVPRPSPARLLELFQDLAGAESVSSQHPVGSVLLLIIYVATWILALEGYYRTRAGEKTKTALQVFVLWFAIPVALMLCISFFKPIMFPRYLLMCVPAAVLLAAQGVIALEQWMPRGRIVSSAVLLVMIILASLSTQAYFGSFDRYGHNWRGVTSYLLSNEKPEDAAIFYTFSGQRGFAYYLERQRESGRQVRPPAVLFPLELNRASIDKSAAPYERVWLILHQTIPTLETDSRTDLIRTTLQMHFRLSEQREFPGIGATRDETGTILVALYTKITGSPEP